MRMTPGAGNPPLSRSVPETGSRRTGSTFRYPLLSFSRGLYAPAVL